MTKRPSLGRGPSEVPEVASSEHVALLQDALASRDAFARQLDEARRLAQLTLELSASIDVQDTMECIIKAMRAVIPDATVAYVMTLSPEAADALLVHVHTPEAVGERYLSRLQDEIDALTEPVAASPGRGDAKEVTGRRSIRLELVEGTYDASRSLASPEVVVLPISFGDASTGFLFVSPPRGSLRSELGLLREITQIASVMMVRLSELLVAERSLLGDLVGSLSDGVLMFGQDGTVLFVNPAFEKALEVAARHQSIDGLLAAIYADSTWVRRETESTPRDVIDAALIRGKLTYVGEFSPRDSRRTFDLAVGPVHRSRDATAGGVLILRDITHAAELAKARNALLATVSHELRTPLTAMTAAVSLVLDGTVGEINDDQRRFLSIAGRNTDRLTRLIDDLLDMSRMASGKMQIRRERIDLRSLTTEVVESFLPQAEGKALGLTLRFPAGDWEVWAEPDRLTQVLSNVISNALKFTREGHVDVVGADLGDHVEIYVADTGPGMPADKIDTVFDEFERADETGEAGRGGTGLGLAIARKIAQAHGGSLNASSQLGCGSVFTLRLPRGLHPSDAAPTTDAGAKT